MRQALRSSSGDTGRGAAQGDDEEVGPRPPACLGAHNTLARTSLLAQGDDTGMPVIIDCGTDSIKARAGPRPVSCRARMTARALACGQAGFAIHTEPLLVVPNVLAELRHPLADVEERYQDKCGADAARCVPAG